MSAHPPAQSTQKKQCRRMVGGCRTKEGDEMERVNRCSDENWCLQHGKAQGGRKRDWQGTLRVILGGSEIAVFLFSFFFYLRWKTNVAFPTI